LYITGLSGVIEGDLLYKKECLFGEGPVMDASNDDDPSHTNTSEMDASAETLLEETIQSVKVYYRQLI
jgi:tRNA pseudouridine13 synthase